MSCQDFYDGRLMHAQLEISFLEDRRVENGWLIIVAFLENSLKSVCVCVFMCLCVFLHDNSKRNRSRLEYIVVYENSSDEFDIELCRIKVKVTDVQKFSPFNVERPKVVRCRCSASPVPERWSWFQT